MVKMWDTALIGDFLDFKNGLNKGKEFFGYGTPIVNYTDVYKNRGLKKADIRGKVCLTPDEIHRFDVRKNDVFFTRTSETPDEVGMSSVLLEDVENGVFSGFVLRGRPKNDMLVPEYCKYCFSTEAVRNAIITGCTYTTRALTNGKQLSAIELPVPPKPEQEAIAEALTDIDTLIVNLEKLIAKKKAIKQGAMQELLTGKRRLPGFDGEWKTKAISDIAIILDDHRIPVKESDREKMEGDIPYCGANGVLGYVNDYTIDGDIILIAEDGGYFDEYATRPIAYKMAGKCWVNNHAHILQSKSNTNQDYLFYGLVHKDIRDFITSGTRSKLNKSELLKIIVALPVDFNEQTAIASILTDMDNEITVLKNRLFKLQNIKTGMMSELLTGRIRLIDKGDA